MAFKKTKVCTAVLTVISGALVLPGLVQAQQATETAAPSDQRIEVTGSRIKRAAAEGALPVTVVSREQLEASGQVTVADFMRTVSFASFGNFRPQSGSSAQSFSEVNLRGLGSRRTLVLVDGRRVAKSPNVGDAADINSIPMAAVERIEILTDGASAIYGSDAIGGVVNVIMRKDFEGGVLRYGQTSPSVTGGDREEMSAVFGLSGDKGRMIIGASSNSRDIVFQRDSPLGVTRGASSFSNNFFTTPGLGGFLGAVGGEPGCNAVDGGNLFYFAGGRCRYDFTGTAADEAATTNKSIFGRGDVQINENWSAYFNGSVVRNTSFGRYAPVPGVVPIRPGTAGDLVDRSPGTPGAALAADQTYFLAHRFAAGGNRDTESDAQLYDAQVGVRGAVAGWDLELGARKTISQYYEIGRGYVVQTLAQQAIEAGDYDIRNPFGADPLVLAGFTTNTGRDSLWSQREIYASATRDLFAMAGGNAALFVGIENRTEDYSDLYDSLSEGGVVLGSSGNSAGGGREVNSLAGELLLPLTKTLEATISARYEKYSDYGSDFSPKVALRFQPTSDVTLRASYGKGFSAPTLPQLTQKPQPSADSIVDRAHCLADGNAAAFCDRPAAPSFQINGLVISNPALSSEKATQYALGGVWDVTPTLSLEATYWNIKISDVISELEAQDLVNRDNGSSALPIPAGLSVTRDASGFITQVVRGSTNEGELERTGLDVSVQFQHKYATLGSFRHSLVYSHLLKASTNGVAIEGDFGAPTDRATISNGWSMGPFGINWNVNYIGKNGDDGVGFVGSYVTHDVQANWQTPIKGLKATFGVLNAGGKLPQLVSDDTRQFNFDLYDSYGKQVYGRIELAF
jgi:iron complex outermembrane receptor protein